MANTRDIVITISADGSAAIAGMGKVDAATEKFGTSQQSTFQQLKSGWMAYTAAVYAAAKSLEAAWKLADDAMRIDAQLQMLDRLSSKYNTTGTQIAKSLQTAANGVISMGEAIGLATKGIFSGLDPTQLTQLMTITGAVARANGITVAEAYEKIATAAETGRSRGLKQLGVIIDLEKANELYAARLNTTSKELTEAEKQVAAVNAILSRQGKIMDELGPAQENMRTKVLQLKSAWADLKDEIGGVLVQLASGAFSALDRIATSFGNSLAYADRASGASGSWGDPAGGTEENVRATNIAKGYAAMLAALSKYYADSETLRAEDIVKEQQAFDSRLGLQQYYLKTGITGIDGIRKRTAEAYAAEKVLAQERQGGLDSYLGLLKYQWATEKQQDEEKLKRQQEMLKAQLAIADAALKAAGNTGSIPGMDDFFKSMSGFVNAYAGLDSGPWDAWAKSVEAAHDKVVASYMAGEAKMADVDKAAKAAEAAREQAYWMTRVQLAADSFGMMANMANSFYLLGGKQGGAAFEMMKAFQVGQAVMNTYAAAIASYNALASIPYVGPYLGAAAAAAAIAFGATQVTAIANTKPGDSSVSSSSAAVTSGSTSTSDTSSSGSSSTTVSEPTAQSPVYNIYIAGNVVDHDEFARELIASLDKARADGVR